MKNFIIIATLITSLGFVSVIPNIFADEQVPGFVIAVEGDPYYFSAHNFGIETLQYFERDFSPYIISGITDNSSTMDEIMTAYNENKKQITDGVIVSDKNRALVFQVTFSNGDIKEKQTIDSFQKFTHLQDSDSGLSQKGLKLESLLSSENKWFYENILLRYINSGDKPEPFDIDVDVITGDSSTLQKWQYSNCVVTDYIPYLDENLLDLKFVGSMVSEIRDKIDFDCAGFSVDFNLVDISSDLVLDKTDFIPTKNTQAKQIIVEFSGGELENILPSYSFSKFTPIKQVQDLPVFVPGYTIDDTPRFALESLPSKDKEALYVGISKYILPGKDPEPFDVSVHLASDSGEIIQTWNYSKCSATNYVTFFIDNLLLFKFKQTFGSEIRDKISFECTGLIFDPTSDDDAKQTLSIIPNAFERAQTFVVSFTGPDISPEKTVTSFTRFSPITNEESPLLLPNYVFGEKPKFYLESLPSKDKQWYYQLISRYINAGSVPEPFTTTINVVTGDNTTIQEWTYTDCEVLEYQPFLEDLLFKRKFTNEYNSEIRDRTIFECNGYAFDGTSTANENISEHALSYTDFIPNDNNRVQRFVVTLSDGDFSNPLTMHTVGKFTPTIEQRGEIYYRFIDGKATVYSNEPVSSSVSASVSTNSNDDLYTIFDKKNPCEKKNPPPHCGDDGHPGKDACEKENPPPRCDDSKEPPIPTPEPVPVPDPVPATPSPSYYIAVDEPHLSMVEKNTHQKSLQFTLESLPSKDKEEFYEFASRYYNPEMTKPQPFDVTVDLVTGDGAILQSWKYSKCDLDSFDTYLQDNLLYFTMNGKKATSEIKDTSSFHCVGFSVDFDENTTKHDELNLVLDDSNRAIFYLAHVNGGEFKSQKSTMLIQKINTLPENNLMLTGLSNVINEDYYDFVGKYINTGKDPENFDFRYDVVTGDGTILFSGKYSECQVVDFSTFYNDQIFYLKFASPIQPEIRSQVILDCIGMDLIVSPLKDLTFDTTGNLKKLSPLTQRTINIPSDDTVCNDGKSVMIRPPKNIAVCIKDEHISLFEDKGWLLSKFLTNHTYPKTLTQPIPTFDERAISFSVTFEGSDISPAKISDTFSKFVPANDESRFLSPTNPLDDGAKEFYLESLPSKDKDWYYELLSQHINPGATPEPFNISVQVLAGNDDLIQEWNYSECTRNSYELFLDDSLLTYNFHQKWDSEIKDRTFFQCIGLNLSTS